MVSNTQALQQAPLADQGGRMKSQVKGAIEPEISSTLQKYSAAKRPLTAISLSSSRVLDTERQVI